MSTYTKTPSSSDIVFLNDSNIVHDINTNVSNAIASQSLVSELSDTVSNTYVSAADAKMEIATANNLTAQSLSAVDLTASVVSLSDVTVNNLTAANGNVSSLTVNGLTSTGEVKASELNITGDAGNVNVANVNANNQISVYGDAFIANKDGSVTAKNLSAETLSVKTSLTVDNSITANNTGLTTNALVADSITVNDVLTAENDEIKTDTAILAPALSTTSMTAITATETTANISTLNATTATLTSINATAATANELIVQNKCIVADKLSADSNGLSTVGRLSTNSDIRADNLSTATITAETSLNVSTSLTATDTGITATNISAKILSGADTISATNISAAGLTSQSVSTNSLTVADTAVFSVNGIRIGTDSTTNTLSISNSYLNLTVPDSTGNNEDPNLLINGKRFKDYYAGYLSDGYIDSVSVCTSAIDGAGIDVRGLKFTWKGVGKDPTFIPLSSLGGIYNEAGRIIKIDKSNANSFTISADEATISTLIKTALSDDFGIGAIKDELSNKIKYAVDDRVSAINSLTIKKLNASSYEQLSQKDLSDTIFVIDDENMNMFNSRITNLAVPSSATDAATKGYVDTSAETLSGQLTNLMSATSAETLTSANIYTDNAKVAISSNMSFFKNDSESKLSLQINDTPIAYFSYGDFIKDGMLDNVEVSTINNINCLVFTFNTDATDDGHKIITIPLTSLAEIYTAGKYITLQQNPSGDVSHNTSIIDINTDKVLAILRKNGETLGSWDAPATDSPLAKLSAAIKTVVLDNNGALKAALAGSGTGTDWNSPANNTPIKTLSDSIVNTIDVDYLKAKLAGTATNAWNEPSANTPLNNLSAGILTALFGRNDWNTNSSPSADSPLYKLSSVIATNIKGNITTNDIVTALIGNSNDWAAPAENSPLYKLSTEIKAKVLDIGDNGALEYALVGNAEGDDWTSPAPSSPLGQLSGKIKVKVKESINKTDLSSLWKNEAADSGQWDAPVDNTPFSKLSGAISTAILADVIAKDEAISTSLSNTISTTYVSSSILSDYVSKEALSVGNDSYMSTLMDNYYTAAFADATFAPIGISTTVANNYVSSSRLADYVSKDELSGSSSYISTLMNNYYSADSVDENFETIEHVDQLITNLTAGVSDLTLITALSDDTDNALTADGGNTDILSAKIETIINGMNTIIELLSGINKNPPATP